MAHVLHAMTRGQIVRRLEKLGIEPTTARGTLPTKKALIESITSDRQRTLAVLDADRDIRVEYEDLPIDMLREVYCAAVAAEGLRVPSCATLRKAEIIRRIKREDLENQVIEEIAKRKRKNARWKKWVVFIGAGVIVAASAVALAAVIRRQGGNVDVPPLASKDLPVAVDEESSTEDKASFISGAKTVGKKAARVVAAALPTDTMAGRAAREIVNQADAGARSTQDHQDAVVRAIQDAEVAEAGMTEAQREERELKLEERRLKTQKAVQDLAAAEAKTGLEKQKIEAKTEEAKIRAAADVEKARIAAAATAERENARLRAQLEGSERKLDELRLKAELETDKVQNQVIAKEMEAEIKLRADLEKRRRDLLEEERKRELKLQDEARKREQQLEDEARKRQQKLDDDLQKERERVIAADIRRFPFGRDIRSPSDVVMGEAPRPGIVPDEEDVVMGDVSIPEPSQVADAFTGAGPSVIDVVPERPSITTQDAGRPIRGSARARRMRAVRFDPLRT